MLEDLINLKKELEEKTKDSYIPCLSFSKNQEGKIISSSEIVASENTDEVFTQLEEYLKEAVILFDKYDVSYDSIILSSGVGFFLKPSYLTEWRKIQEKVEGLSYEGSTPKDNIFNVYFRELAKTIDANVYKKLVPVSFGMYEWGVYFEDDYSFDYSYPDEISSLFEKRVTGVVDFDLFVKKLKENGYKTGLLGYGECNSFNDLVGAAKDLGECAQIDVVADFTLEKVH